MANEADFPKLGTVRAALDVANIVGAPLNGAAESAINMAIRAVGASKSKLIFKPQKIEVGSVVWGLALSDCGTLEIVCLMPDCVRYAVLVPLGKRRFMIDCQQVDYSDLEGRLRWLTEQAENQNTGAPLIIQN